MTSRIKWTLVGLAVALLVAGTLRTLSARQDKQAALQTQQAEQKTQVTIDLQGSDLLPLTRRDLPLTVAISGAITAVNTAVVKARVAGDLQGLKVREGDRVKAGQVLGHIEPTEFDARLRQARQQALAARAQVDIAQRTHENNLALVAQGFISNTALVTSQANLANAQATYAAAQSAADVSAKSLSDTVLRAPINGMVSQRVAQPGERVAIDAHVELGQQAQLHIDGLSTPVSAKVVRINPSATVGSRAVMVYLAVAPGSGLRHGLFAEGTLSVGKLSALAVPLNAVHTDQPQPYIQIVQAHQVRHLTVTLGPRSAVDNQTVVSIVGADEGATVISGTVGVLREGTPVKIATKTQGAN